MRLFVCVIGVCLSSVGLYIGIMFLLRKWLFV